MRVWVRSCVGDVRRRDGRGAQVAGLVHVRAGAGLRIHAGEGAGPRVRDGCAVAWVHVGHPRPSVSARCRGGRPCRVCRGEAQGAAACRDEQAATAGAEGLGSGVRGAAGWHCATPASASSGDGARSRSRGAGGRASCGPRSTASRSVRRRDPASARAVVLFAQDCIARMTARCPGSRCCGRCSADVERRRWAGARQRRPGWGSGTARVRAWARPSRVRASVRCRGDASALAGRSAGGYHAGS